MQDLQQQKVSNTSYANRLKVALTEYMQFTSIQPRGNHFCDSLV